jgi:hypothetical protein
MKLLLSLMVLIAFVPPMVSAQEDGTDVPAEGASPYAETVTIANGFLYYVTSPEEGGGLSASAHDTNGDGALDVWFTYTEGIVASEAYDYDRDGEPDTTLTLSPDGSVVAISGPGSADFETRTPSQFVPAADAALPPAEELVGDLSNITLEKEQYGAVLFLLLLAAGGLLYFFVKRQR